MTALEKSPDDWWTSITVVQKEHVASKLATKANGTPTHVEYRAASNWWNVLTDGEKKSIQHHCIEEHWFEGTKEQEGESYSY